MSSPSWGTIPFGGELNTQYQQSQQYALIGSHWDEDQRVFFTGIKESTVDDTYDVTFRAARACLWVTIHVQSEGTGGRDYDAATFESSTRYDMRQDRVREIEVTTDGAQSYYIWAIPEFEQTADGTFYKYDGVDADDHMAFTEIRPGLPPTVLQGTLTSGSIPYATASDTLADTSFDYNGSGQMRAPNGGPFQPAYSFGDQTQMGMYRKGADELALYGGASGWTLFMDQPVVDLYWGAAFASGVQDMIQMRDGVARPSLYMGVSGDLTNTTTSQIYVYGSGSSSNLVFRGGDNNAGATFVTNAVTGDKGYAAIYAEGSGAAGQSNYGAFYAYSVNDSEIGVTAAGASQGTIAGRLSANTGLRTVDGDASTPAWSFESDPDTGVYLSSAGNLTFATAGGERLNLTDAGLLEMSGTAGLALNPGSDQDTDIITVGVTGSPKIYWDESTDQFHSTKGLWLNTAGTNNDGAITIGALNTWDLWTENNDLELHIGIVGQDLFEFGQTQFIPSTGGIALGSSTRAWDTVYANSYRLRNNGTMLSVQDADRFGNAGWRFQGSNANQVSAVSMAPTGTADRSIFRLYNDSDTANTQALEIEVDGTFARLRAGQSFGTGSTAITEFYINAANSAATTSLRLQVAGSDHLIAGSAAGGSGWVYVPNNLRAAALRVDDGAALGGGATPTLGTIGGSGPATAGQNSWLRVNISGTDHWIPVWQ